VNAQEDWDGKVLAVELALGSLCIPLLAVALICGLRHRIRLDWHVGATVIALSLLVGVAISVHLSEFVPLGLTVLAVAVGRTLDDT
jgi:hypothetical protein